MILGFGVLLCFIGIKASQAQKQRVSRAFWEIATPYRYYIDTEKVNLPVPNWGGTWFPWLAAIWNIRYARESIHRGYDKYKDYAFQIPTLSRWEIYICNEQMIKEYRNLDSTKMSANALFQAEYCLPGAMENIHKIDVPILSKGLIWQKMRAATKEDTYFYQFYEEFTFAFKAEMPAIDGDGSWTAIPCFQLATRIVSRMTAKSLVGRPLCRDPELVDLFCDYGNVVPPNGFFLGSLPNFLKPFVASFLASPKMSRRLQSIVLAEATKRRASGIKRKNVGWDFTDWLMNWVDETAPTEYDDTHVAVQIANIVFGAIHTTSQLLVHTIYELATRPSYIPSLRAEITSSISQHSGWTKDALESMHKLDSFVRESQRWNPLDAGSMARRVMQDFTFSNGVRIPAGNWIFAVNSPVLRDEKHYPHPAEFDGFRFARIREQEGQERAHTLVTSSLSNMQFGDGRHGCPGKYMAADEIRMTIAHILVNYDITIEGHGPRPRNVVLGKFIFPDLKAKIMFRKIRN
ncbi:cytochrome P450 [Lepidopterella palustris CBS 459.81]|uniref:Cytochrome P450 n=1 Tax=Lepidopterella palustris CBS 459.81 TaxID=1314670 RepID=A0A8E2ECA1_9PEZI|nr:cytochrome P450 [Lepidopterella palustris CBS 459.81]